MNVLELKAIHLAFLVFTKGQNQYTFKYTIFVLSHKRHSKSANIGEFAEEICYRGNFDFFIEQEHSNYSRVVLSKQVEREAYQDYRRIIDYPEWINIKSKGFLENLSQSSHSRNKLVCIDAFPPAEELLFMETRSIQAGNRCISIELVKKIPLCISLFFVDFKSVKKCTERSSGNDYFSCFNLAGSTSIYRTTKYIKTMTISDFVDKGTFH